MRESSQQQRLKKGQMMKMHFAAHTFTGAWALSLCSISLSLSHESEKEPENNRRFIKWSLKYGFYLLYALFFSSFIFQWPRSANMNERTVKNARDYVKCDTRTHSLHIKWIGHFDTRHIRNSILKRILKFAAIELLVLVRWTFQISIWLSPIIQLLRSHCSAFRQLS